MRFDFVVARNHFRAPLSEPGDFQDALDGSLFAMFAKLAHQLVQPHDADFRVPQRFEVQQIFKFLFVLFFGFFLHREENFMPGILQYIGDVFGAGLARFAVIRNQS